MNSNKVKTVLETLADANSIDTELWAKLPNQASGAEWAGEILDTASSMKYCLHVDEVSEDYLRDLVGEYANGECEDYYLNIHNRVTRLNLWAIDELDEEVQVLNSGVRDYPSMTDLEAQYLYAACQILWLAVAEWAIEKAEEMEEVSA